MTLVKAKETRETVKEYFQPSLQKLASLDSSGISSDDGIQISVRTEISMVDGKMVDILVGDSGAFCHYCHTTRNEANDLLHILQRFQITDHLRKQRTSGKS